MARPRTPSALLELNGTFESHPGRKRAREREPKPSEPLGPPPTHLQEQEAAVWLELSGLMPYGVATNLDRPTFEIACCLLTKFRYSRGTMSGAQMSLLATLLGRFGMSPAERSRITVPEAKNDALDEFLARGATKANASKAN
jgi:hypothetical protein